MTIYQLSERKAGVGKIITRTSQICIFDNENSSFARFARAFFIRGHLADLLVLSMT